MHCHAGDVGGAAGVRTGIEGREVRVGRIDDHINRGYAKRFGCHLCQYRVAAGAEVGGADEHVEAAVIVDLDACCAHVQTWDCRAMHA